MSGKEVTNSTTKVIAGAEDSEKKSRRAPAILVLLVGPQGMVGKEWTLEGKSFTIGRYNTSEILVPEKSLSKAHARITIMDGVYSIADLGATNKTFVNGTKLAEYSTYQLRHNDQIKAGSVVFKFLDKP